MAGLVRLYCKTAHGEVGSHPVLYISLRQTPLQSQMQVIKEGVIRGPGDKIGNNQRKIRLFGG